MMNRKTFLKSMIFAGGATLAGGSAYALHSVDLEISRQQVPVSGLDRKLRVVALSDLHAPCYLHLHAGSDPHGQCAKARRADPGRGYVQ